MLWWQAQRNESLLDEAVKVVKANPSHPPFVDKPSRQGQGFVKDSEDPVTFADWLEGIGDPDTGERDPHRPLGKRVCASCTRCMR